MNPQLAYRLGQLLGIVLAHAIADRLSRARPGAELDIGLLEDPRRDPLSDCDSEPFDDERC